MPPLKAKLSLGSVPFPSFVYGSSRSIAYSSHEIWELPVSCSRIRASGVCGLEMETIEINYDLQKQIVI